MKRIFFDLLRSNFRCGRMLTSRADVMAGCIGAPHCSCKTRER